MRIEQGVDEPPPWRARGKVRERHSSRHGSVDVAFGGAHLDQREQHRAERLAILGRATLEHGLGLRGNRALQPAQALVSRIGKRVSVSFHHIASVELVKKIRKQRKRTRLACYFL